MKWQERVRKYVELKRRLGYVYKVNELVLRAYARHADQAGDEFLVSERMIEWARMSSSPSFAWKRLEVLRCFAVWQHAEDSRHEIPPRGALGSGFNSRKAPVLLSREQIQRLLAAALDLPPRGSITPYTFHYLLGLLASTGLRQSEGTVWRQLRSEQNIGIRVYLHSIGIRVSSESRWLVPMRPRCSDFCGVLGYRSAENLLRGRVGHRRDILAPAGQLLGHRRCEPCLRSFVVRRTKRSVGPVGCAGLGPAALAARPRISPPRGGTARSSRSRSSAGTRVGLSEGPQARGVDQLRSEPAGRTRRHAHRASQPVERRRRRTADGTEQECRLHAEEEGYGLPRAAVLRRQTSHATRP